MHSRQIADYGGVVNTMPKFAALMVLFALANAGLPGTSGFVGEFFVIIGSFHASAWLAFFAATTLVLGAAYTLWMVKRVVFGKVASPRIAKLADLSRREIVMFASLALIVLMVGVDPKPFTDAIDPTVARLIEDASRSKLPAGDGVAPAQPAFMASAHG
jgi:NADH-quinone oxidoreductase subunit M